MHTIPRLILCALFSLSAVHGGELPAEPETVFLWPAKVEEFKDKPTEEISKKTKGGILRLGKIHSPSITVYPAADTGKPTPAVVICPGGGYVLLVIENTGIDFAKWLNTFGVTGIVLKYTVPNKRKEALQDVQRAMGVVRQNAKKWNIDPNQVGIMGSSAGSNLATRLCASSEKRTYEAIDEADQLNCRPDFCVLMSPAWLDATTVTANHPPSFIVQAKDDGFLKPTPAYVEALEEKKVPVEFLLFDKGGHGIGLGATKPPLSTWPGLAEKWIKQTIAGTKR